MIEDRRRGKRPLGLIFGGLTIIALTLLFGYYYFRPFAASEPVQQVLKQPFSFRSAVSEEERQRGFHCLDEKGMHPEVVEYVETILAEPNTFQHFGTRIYPVRHGRHFLVMRYQAIAKHGSRVAGGVVKTQVDHDSCAPDEIERVE